MNHENKHKTDSYQLLKTKWVEANSTTNAIGVGDVIIQKTTTITKTISSPIIGDMGGGGLEKDLWQYMHKVAALKIPLKHDPPYLQEPRS